MPVSVLNVPDSIGTVTAKSGREVRILSDETHAVVDDDVHLGVIGLAQYLRRKDVIGRTIGDDVAVHANDGREVRRDRIELVRRDDHGDPIAVQLAKEMQDVVTRSDVDAGRGLIEQEELGVAHQCTGEEYTLLLSAGQSADVTLRVLRHAETVEDAAHPVAILFARPRQQSRVHGAAHQHDFLHGDGEIPVDGLELWDVSGGGAAGTAHAPTVDQDLALLDGHRAEERAKQRRLSGPARTENADELPLFDAERDVLDRRLTVVAGGNVPQGH